jgi:UDP-N-acetylmuramate dehydrogenase
MDEKLIEEIKNLVKDVRINEPMSLHTSFKIGGPAEIFVVPDSYREIENILKFSWENKIKIRVIGGGTNILVSDRGLKGIVLKISKLNKIKLKNDEIIVEGGLKDKRFCDFVCKEGISGYEFLAGIPGTLGGAIVQNAGAYGRSISEKVKEVYFFERKGSLSKLSSKELEFGYRKSIFKRIFGVVVKICLKLEEIEEPSKIYKKMQEILNEREKKFPLQYPSAGSFFKKVDNISAGKIIEECGLGGLRIGDAEVSLKHKNFIINRGNATFKDVQKLSRLIKETVFEKKGILLEEEVVILK